MKMENDNQNCYTFRKVPVSKKGNLIAEKRIFGKSTFEKEEGVIFDISNQGKKLIIRLESIFGHNSP